MEEIEKLIEEKTNKLKELEDINIDNKQLGYYHFIQGEINAYKTALRILTPKH